MSKNDTKTERLIVPLTEGMVEQIDDYWHEHRLRSRSEAVRHLLTYALSKNPRPPKLG